MKNCFRRKAELYYLLYSKPLLLNRKSNFFHKLFQDKIQKILDARLGKKAKVFYSANLFHKKFSG